MSEPIWTFGEMFEVQRRKIAELEAAHEQLCAEIVRLTDEVGALGAWQCADCGARFGQAVELASLDGVTRCSRCAERWACPDCGMVTISSQDCPGCEIRRLETQLAATRRRVYARCAEIAWDRARAVITEDDSKTAAAIARAIEADAEMGEATT